ncbi:MAG TPA: threonine/serine exporter family protein [Prolixibacteraceae bacterium]
MDKSLHKVKEAEAMLLNVGTLLMSSGASTGRVRTTVNRIADALGYNIELMITNRSLMLKVIDEDSDQFIASLKRTSPHGVNFRIVSGISRMSWRVVEDHWNIPQINAEVDRLVALPHYPRLITLSSVALAGASFCALFGGKGYELLVAFIATFVGLFVRQEALKKRFNPYVSIIFAAFAASILSGLSVKLGIGSSPDLAFATSVLFLVPGVPLINSFTDMIDGNILNGIVRGIHGLVIALAIALGLLCAKYLLNI